MARNLQLYPTQPSLRTEAHLDCTQPEHRCSKLLQNVSNYLQTDKVSYAKGFEPPLIPKQQYKILYHNQQFHRRNLYFNKIFTKIK